MATRDPEDTGPDRADPNRPVEIPLTDVEAAREDKHHHGVHEAGTPAGGTAAGGLAGTNINDGSPNNSDIDSALGSGIDDTDENEEDVEEEEEGRAFRRRKRLT
jgi:hypothetical protein